MPWRAVYENSVQLFKNKFSSKIKNGRLLCRLTGSSPHHGKAQFLKPFASWVRRVSLLGSMTFTWKHIFLGSQGGYQQQTPFEDVLLKSHTTSLTEARRNQRFTPLTKRVCWWTRGPHGAIRETEKTVERKVDRRKGRSVVKSGHSCPFLSYIKPTIKSTGRQRSQCRI